MQQIAKNIQKIKSNISLACEQSRRNICEITILAATKMVVPALINEAIKNGIKVSSENRVQDFIAKYDSIQGVDWHFIGSLQTNKVKYIIDKVSLIHSIDRESLASEVQRQAEKIEKKIDVLIEINMGDETSKSGVKKENLQSLVDFISSKPNLNLRGFMPILPIDAHEKFYIEANQIYQKHKQNNKNITILSMGMSDDYMTAIRHGATLVRLGSCLFGKRNY